MILVLPFAASRVGGARQVSMTLGQSGSKFCALCCFFPKLRVPFNNYLSAVEVKKRSGKLRERFGMPRPTSQQQPVLD